MGICHLALFKALFPAEPQQYSHQWARDKERYQPYNYYILYIHSQLLEILIKTVQLVKATWHHTIDYFIPVVLAGNATLVVVVAREILPLFAKPRITGQHYRDLKVDYRLVYGVTVDMQMHSNRSTWTIEWPYRVVIVPRNATNSFTIADLQKISTSAILVFARKR